MKSKGMQLGAMLAAMMLVSVAIMPAVSAKVANEKQNWSDPTTIKNLLDQISKAGDKAGELFVSLPPEAQAVVIENLKAVKVTSNVTKVAHNVSKTIDGVTVQGCDTWVWDRTWYNALGNKLFSYFQEIDWCYNGSSITSDWRNRWGEVYWPFWNFIGHIGSWTEQGGVGYASYRSWTQGQFKYCVSQYGCIEEKDPWLDMTVYGDGLVSGSQGG